MKYEIEIKKKEPSVSGAFWFFLFLAMCMVPFCAK